MSYQFKLKKKERALLNKIGIRVHTIMNNNKNETET